MDWTRNCLKPVSPVYTTENKLSGDLTIFVLLVVFRSKRLRKLCFTTVESRAYLGAAVNRELTVIFTLSLGL